MRNSIVFTLFLLILVGATTTMAQEEKVSLNFDEVDIELIIRFMSDITKTNFIFDKGVVRGKITIISPTEVTVDEAFKAFQSILEVKGFALIPSPDGKMVKIVRAAEAKQSPIKTQIGKKVEEIEPVDAMLTQLIHLDYADANQISGILRPLISKNGLIHPYQPTNDLIIIDTSSNIRRLLKIIEKLDVKGVEVEREIIQIKNASSTTLSAIIQSVLQEAAVPGRPPKPKVLNIIPDDRTSSLIIVASSDDMVKIKALIEELDKEVPTELSPIRVLRIRNAKATDLADVISKIYVKQPARPPVRGVPAVPEVRPTIVPHETTNSLIITASKKDHDAIEAMVKQLDVLQDQVLVEMLIADVSLELIKEIGVELASLDKPVEGSTRGFARTDFGGKLTTFATRATLGKGSGLAAGAHKGWTTIGTLSAINVGFLIDAIESDATTDILSTPQIVTQDNETARIRVGEEVPYVSESRVSEQLVTYETTSFKKAGITLEITPHINQREFVTLEINAEITEIRPESAALKPESIEREIKTTVFVRSGDTIVIGGLISDKKSKGIRKVPVLGDIPLLGFFFRRTEETTKRTSLLIFITPHIIKSFEEMEELTEEKKLESEKFIKEKIEEK